MRKNDSVVGDCKCDQFSQVKVCTERDVDCAVSLRISCRQCLQPIAKMKDRRPSISRSVPHAVMMLLDVTRSRGWPFLGSRDVIGHATIRLPGSTSYGWSIVTMRLSCTVMEICRLKYWTHGRRHGKKDRRRERAKGKGRGKKE